MSRHRFEGIQAKREWIQAQVTKIERQLRRRIRPKLIRAGWYDEDDILSSVRRRLDVRVFKGELPVRNEAQLNHLILKMAEHVAIDKYRKLRRQRHLEQAVALSADQVVRWPFSNDDSPPIDKVISRLPAEDQLLVNLWMDGLSQKEIAQELGIGVEAYRTRRKRLMARLRDKLTKWKAAIPPSAWSSCASTARNQPRS